MLISLLTTDPPFRIITFKVISSLVLHLSFNKKLESSLNKEHQVQLYKAYTLSIGNLQKVLQNP
jgi:hypothetical protein